MLSWTLYEEGLRGDTSDWTAVTGTGRVDCHNSAASSSSTVSRVARMEGALDFIRDDLAHKISIEGMHVTAGGLCMQASVALSCHAAHAPHETLPCGMQMVLYLQMKQFRT